MGLGAYIWERDVAETAHMQRGAWYGGLLAFLAGATGFCAFVTQHRCRNAHPARCNTPRSYCTDAFN
jgi:hypothetical protein